MVKLLSFLALLGLIACKSINQNSKLIDADIFMYSEYIDYISLVSKGSKAINSTLGVERKLTYYYREFESEGIRFLMIYDKQLNQQYLIFYGYNFDKKRKQILEAPSVSGLNLASKVKFNQEILKTFLKIEEFIENKFQKDIKKIVIGFELGGAMANLAVTSLIANSGFKASEFEVISFGLIPFSNSFDIKFDRTSIFLDNDKDFYLNTECCSHISAKKLPLSAPKNKRFNKLEAYTEALKDATLD
jgi:hypothetical protein